ncbi:MAG: hypothetical protein ACPLQP_08230 [Moorellaceae bacterium]
MEQREEETAGAAVVIRGGTSSKHDPGTRETRRRRDGNPGVRYKVKS